MGHLRPNFPKPIQQDTDRASIRPIFAKNQTNVLEPFDIVERRSMTDTQESVV